MGPFCLGDKENMERFDRFVTILNQNPQSK